MRRTIICVGLTLLAAAVPAHGQVSPTAAEPVETGRAWHECKSRGDTAQYYPKKALQMEVAGDAVIQCRVDRRGKVTACDWLSETPVEYEFGEAATKLGCLFRFKAGPPEGQVLRIPIRFKLPR